VGERQQGKFRIPTGADSYGWGIRGCTKKNSVLCYDQDAASSSFPSQNKFSDALAAPGFFFLCLGWNN